MRESLKTLPENLTPENLTDEKLMISYQEGSEKAFEVLYERHSKKVYGYLKNRLKDPSFADDVFQATFLKLHHYRLKYDPSFPFLPWLFTVCKNVMLDHIRKKGRIQEELNPLALEQAETPKPNETVTVPDLSALPVKQQKAIQLRYMQELSFEEIAKRLETSPPNVRQLISRAMKQLRVTLSKGGASND